MNALSSRARLAVFLGLVTVTTVAIVGGLLVTGLSDDTVVLEFEGVGASRTEPFEWPQDGVFEVCWRFPDGSPSGIDIRVRDAVTDQVTTRIREGGPCAPTRPLPSGSYILDFAAPDGVAWVLSVRYEPQDED